jgi:hypothetical protein
MASQVAASARCSRGPSSVDFPFSPEPSSTSSALPRAARVARGAGQPPLARGRWSIATVLSRGDHSCIPIRAMVWPNGGWAIEGATGVGAPLTRRLRADGIEVIDVPAKLATRVRLLSIGHGRNGAAYV